MPLRLLLLSGLLMAAAQAQPTDSLALGEVTVTAAREPLDPRAAPVRVTVLGPEDLDASAAASVADALGARAPLHVRRYGPSGLATVTIRGASASQALVLLDGQRLTDPQLGQVDLGLLPAALVETVEVLSGPASGLYGSDALGGVIHLRPPRAPERAEARLTTDVGPWGERRLSGLAAGWSGPVHALVAAEAGRADDDYAYPDPTRIGTPLTTRQGWDSERSALYASVGAEVGASRAGVSLWAADAERGLGGTETVGTRQWDRRVRLGMTAARRARWGRVEGAATVQKSRLRYATPYPAGGRPDALDETGTTTTAHFDLRTTLHAPARWSWTGALMAGVGRAEHPSVGEGAEERFVGAALSGIGQVGRVALFPTLRADRYVPAAGAPSLALTPQIGMNVSMSETLNLKATLARAFRMPTLNDRFWQPGGNPGLRPEAAWSVDAGAAWAGSGIQAEATGFGALARDQIVWAPTAASYWTPSNVARTRTLGLEGSARGAWRVRLGGQGGTVEAGVVATALDARDLQTRQPLRYVPRWTAKAWGGLGLGSLRLDVGARVVGARPTTATGSQALPPYVVLDAQLGARRHIGPVAITLALAAENLSDTYYEVVRSYPMPPRHARLRLTVRTP